MFRRSVVAIILIPALVMVACGGGDEPEAAGQTDEASGGAAESVTATAEPPTAMPEEPTATAEPPTPTLAPTPTEVTEVGQAEGGSGSADSGQPAAVGSGWGASGGEAQSACDHPYLPMRTGAMWTYETSEGPIIWEVVDVQGDMNEATAVLNVTVGDVSLEYQWQCVAGQGLSSFDFANLTSAPVGLDMTIEQMDVDGQFLLPPEEMVVGASWTAELLGTIAYSQQIEGTSIEATGDMRNVQEHTIVSAEPVAFEGQGAPGLQIEQINTITLVLSLMGTTAEQTFGIDNSYSLGYGIGIVSQSSITDFGTETMNLVDYSIP